jgi:cation transport regulator ChaC
MRREFSKTEKLWYFGYGSNMNSTVFQGRRKMRPTKIERAVLKDYKLVFNQPGIPWLEPSFANIEEAPGHYIEGVVYEITGEEMRLLDISEGNGAYDIVTSNVEADVSGPILAHTFATKNVSHGLHPSLRYMNLLIDGAIEHDLSPEWVQMLREAPYSSGAISRRLSPIIMFINRSCMQIGLPHPFRWWKRYHINRAQRIRSMK